MDSRPARIAACLIATSIVAVLLAPIAYDLVFSIFAPYDDEGYLLVSLKSYIAHGQLYDEVYAGYGPFYYELWAALFSTLGIEVSHDSGRLAVIVVWLLTSGLLGIATARATGSILLGVAVQLLSFRGLYVLIGEPMHPGGLIILLLAFVVVVLFLVLPARPRLGLGLIGALLAALILVKVNVGGFAAISTALVLAATYPLLASRQVLRILIETVFIATPIALIARNLSDDWGLIYAVHVAIACSTVVVALRALSPDRDRDSREIVSLLLGLAGMALVSIGAAVLTGTSPQGLVEGVVIDPIQQPNVLTIPLLLPSGMLIFDFAALAACLICWRAVRGGLDARGWRLALAVASVVAGVLIGMTVAGVIFPEATLNGTGRPELTCLCLAWLALIPQPGTAPAYPGLPTRLLVGLAVLQALHAYPVAGSQVLWSSLLLLPVGAICVANGLRALSLLFPGRAQRPLRISAVGASVAITILSANFVVREGGSEAKETYGAGQPLGLPGAERLRLPPDSVTAFRDTTRLLNEHCGRFLSLPGLDSFYLWTRQDPPSLHNVNDWMYLFDSDLQREVLADVRRYPDLCLLRFKPGLAAYVHGSGFPDRPLLRFVRRKFEPFTAVFAYEVLTRKRD